MLEFLDWISRAGGAVALVVGIAGFVFREKWKQLLARSLAVDLERLKCELAKAQAEHAASLTPQLESIRHDFQQKLEAYKVGLIAEAEGAKAKSELRKSIANKFALLEFDRLVQLEQILGPSYSTVLGAAKVDPPMKTAESTINMHKRLSQLDEASALVEVFLPLDRVKELLAYRQVLLRIISTHVGPGKPKIDDDSPDKEEALKLAASTHAALKTRIRELGAFS